MHELDACDLDLRDLPAPYRTVWGGLAARTQLGLNLSDGKATMAGAALLGHKVPSSPGCLFVEISEHRAPFHVPVPPSRRRSPHPWAVLLETLPAEMDVLPPERADQLEVFRRLVRGILSNAMAHRSFAPEYRDTPIRVQWAPGQVRVISPGPLVDGVIQEGAVLRGVQPRNPRLHAAMRDLGLARMENRGGRDGPHIAKSLGFEMTVISTPTEVTVDLVLDPDLLREAEQREVVAKRRRVPAAVRREQILNALDEHGPLHRKALESLLGVKRSTLSADLRHLVEAGQVAREADSARSPDQRYRRAPGSRRSRRDR